MPSTPRKFTCWSVVLMISIASSSGPFGPVVETSLTSTASTAMTSGAPGSSAAAAIPANAVVLANARAVARSAVDALSLSSREDERIFLVAAGSIRGNDLSCRRD